MHCLQTSVFLNKNAGVSVHYPSLSLWYFLRSLFCGCLASVLIKGMRGTVCNKAISSLPILSSFIRLQAHTHTHTHTHTVEHFESFGTGQMNK